MFNFALVTTCKNAAATIDTTVWSIVSQEGGYTIRYHIQDAVSTDGTLEKIIKWKERIDNAGDCYPSRIVFSFASAKDDGMYHGIDTAMQAIAPADDIFTGWLNGDDILWPGAVKAIVQFGESCSQAKWVTGFHTGINQHGKVDWLGQNYYFPREILAAGLADGVHWRFLQQESTFWRYGLYKQAKGLNTSFKCSGDWDLWRRFAQLTPLVHMQRQLGAYRMRPGQISSDTTSYWGEMESSMPAEKRAVRAQGLLASKDASFDIYYADQNQDGDWLMDKVHLKVEHMAKAEHFPPRTMHMVVAHPKSKEVAPLFQEGFVADDYTYLRVSDVQKLAQAYLANPYGKLDINFCDLKACQDALCTAFIDQQLSSHAKILEIGGGCSRVLPLFHGKHECWNIDKFEGLGNGPQSVPHASYKIVVDYMGAFNKALPESYFDLVFSTSTLEHVPEQEDVFNNIMEDIDRVLKPGGWSLHLFDVVDNHHGGSFWTNAFVHHIFKNVSTCNKFINVEDVPYCNEIYWMSKMSYEALWRPITKKSYEEFGQPTTLQILWRKPL